jgi:tetratricopeptide (TPR) repeat protein
MISLAKAKHRFLLLIFVLIGAAGASIVTAQSDDKAQQAIELFNKGQDAHEKGDVGAAVKLYEGAIEILPEFPEAQLQRGSALVTLGRFDEAEKAFRRALELREDWTLAMATLGSLLVDRGKYAESEKLLTAAIAADESNSLALTAMSYLRIKTNADETALRTTLGKLNALSSRARPTAALLTAKAAVELRLNDQAAAKVSVGRALELEPKNSAANILAADIALTEKDIDRAESYLTAAENSGQISDETKRLRGSALIMRGKKSDALAILESISSPSDSVKTLIADVKDGDIADLAGLEAKAQRDPNDANALSKLCQGYRLGNPAKAVEYCRRASTLEPNEIGHAIGFGAALVQAKQYDQAIGLFRKLLTIAPEHATIRANLATALFQLKRYPEAKTEFRWLTENQPDSPTAFYFLGIVHDQMGEYLDAMANYQQFIKMADAEKDKLDIEKVNLRLPLVQKQIKNGKGKKSE